VATRTSTAIPRPERCTEGAEGARDIVDGLQGFTTLCKEESRRFNLAEIIENAVRRVIQAHLPSSSCGQR